MVLTQNITVYDAENIDLSKVSNGLTADTLLPQGTNVSLLQTRKVEDVVYCLIQHPVREQVGDGTGTRFAWVESTLLR